MGHRERMAAKRVRRKDKEQGQGSETAREASEPFGTFVALSSYRHSAVTLMAPPSRVNLLGGCTMSNAFDRAECCHKLAEECRRLSRMCRSIEMQIHYARMSEHYNTLADAELIGGLAYEHSLAEDGISPAGLNERHDATWRRRSRVHRWRAGQRAAATADEVDGASRLHG